MRSLIAIALFVSFSTAHAFDFQAFLGDLKQKARPHLVKILGEEKVNELLGSEFEKIAMPAIPELKKESTSVDVYSRNEYPGTVKMSDKDSEKYNFFFVQEVFEAVRKREANDNEISQWMNVLQQGGTREGVYRGLVLDQTYAGLENFPLPVNDSIVNFASRILEVYTGKKYEKEKLLGFNFFALKRAVTERALEVIDAYGNNQADLEAWYALLSVEMAQDYPSVFKNQTRTSVDPSVHRNWAKNFSTQYLKSEVIVKIHKIFNSLI